MDFINICLQQSLSQPKSNRISKVKLSIDFLALLWKNQQKLKRRFLKENGKSSTFARVEKFLSEVIIRLHRFSLGVFLIFQFPSIHRSQLSINYYFFLLFSGYHSKQYKSNIKKGSVSKFFCWTKITDSWVKLLMIHC